MYLPEAVKYIIDRLENFGHEAYAVGGCVRDTILERNPDDWDITTSAKPEETKSLFEKTFDTGIEHGTITVLIDNVGYEVTTYRIDGEYEDSRRPNEVSFTSSLKEDLLRRDFTINAMAYNESKGLVDIFGGVQDLRYEKIRCVGDANERFTEDALRILRAVRFSAQLGFEIEESTRKGIKELAPTLKNISAERIQVEMVKLLVSKHPEYISEAYDMGITKIIFPEWDELMGTLVDGEMISCAVKAMERMKNTSPEKVERLAAMLLDCGTILDQKSQGEMDGSVLARQVLKRWKMDNNTVELVCKLVKANNVVIEATYPKVRKAMNQIGKEIFQVYLNVQYADAMTLSKEARNIRLNKLNQIKEIYFDILLRKQCVDLKGLEIDGADLLKMGVEQGKQIGVILHALLNAVLEDEEKNKKVILIEMAKDMY